MLIDCHLEMCNRSVITISHTSTIIHVNTNHESNKQSTELCMNIVISIPMWMRCMHEFKNVQPCMHCTLKRLKHMLQRNRTLLPGMCFISSRNIVVTTNELSKGI